MRGRRLFEDPLCGWVRQRHGCDSDRAAGTRHRSWRRSGDDPVHLLRDRRDDSQRRRDTRLRGHRSEDVQHRPGPRRRGGDPEDEGGGSGRPLRADGPDRGDPASAPDDADHRGCGAEHRRAADDRRRVGDGGAGRDDRHLLVLPLEEPRRLRRRRDDRHAGRGALQAVAAPADAWLGADLLPRRGRVQLAPRRPAGGRPQRQAPAPRGVECRAARERGLLHRRLRRHRGDRPAVHRSGERVDLQPVHHSRPAARRAQGASAGQGDRALGLLPAAAPPAALLRVPRLP